MSNKQRSQFWTAPSARRIVAVVGLIIALLVVSGLAVLAQDNSAFVRQVRAIDTSELGISNPAGLVFLPAANLLQVVEAQQPGQPSASFSDIIGITPLRDRVGPVRIPAAISEPINMAFDGKANQLLAFQRNNKQLLAIAVGPDAQLDSKTLKRYNAARFGLQDPQGMAVDPANGTLFILDSAGQEIVRVKPGADGSFDNAEISRVPLAGLPGLRGLAFDAANGNLYVLSPAGQTLYELSPTGRVIATRDLTTFGLKDPQGMVFAPSGDLTDDPSQMSLYIADSGGQIVELSFAEIAVPDALIVTPIKRQEIETNNWLPPSTDPSGITYLGNGAGVPPDTFLVVDCDVDETIWFSPTVQVNMWEISRTGVVTKTFSLMHWTSEPTGVALNPTNKHLFFTDDNAKKLFEMAAGTDGKYATTDDVVTSFKTDTFGSTDPEAIAYDSSDGTLWVADGINAEIYHIAPGPNGKFNGPPPGGDDVVTHFDTAILGMFDASGIALDTDAPYLYVTGKPNNVWHLTKSGAIVRIIDLDAGHIHTLGTSGLALAPATRITEQDRYNLYITDRQTDNSQDPTQNDGRIWEARLPSLPSYLVDVFPSKATVAGNPGAQVVYNLQVTNVGRSPSSDTYNVTATGYTWAPTFPATVGPLAQGASANMQVTVNVPPDARCDQKSKATLTVASAGHSGVSATAVLTTTVTQIPPVANDDRYEIEGQSLVEPAPGVLGNDSAGNCGSLTATLVTPPSHGTVQLQPDGSFTYTRAPGFTGTDTFTYNASAGALSDPATVTIGPARYYLYLPIVTKSFGQ